MDNSGTYLLKAICNHEKNGYTTLGEFNAKHFTDISKLMTEFAIETLKDVTEHLNKGETINLGDGTTLSLTRKSPIQKTKQTVIF